MALTFYMNMVSGMMPQSSETPLIGIYFSCIMVMVATSVVSKTIDLKSICGDLTFRRMLNVK